MKLHWFILVTLLGGGCENTMPFPFSPISDHSLRHPDQQRNPPHEIVPKYPRTIRFTPERYDTFIARWRTFTEAYHLTFYVPSFDSILMVPVAGAVPHINLFPNQSDTISISEVRDSLTMFMYRWRRLFNIDPFAFTKTFQGDIGVYRFDFERGSSGTSTVTNSCVDDWCSGHQNLVSALVSKRGALMRFESDCAPDSSIPTNIHHSLSEAISKVTGKVMVYYDWTGRDSLTISPEKIEGAVLVPVILPRYSASWQVPALEYRRCWRLKVPVFFVYVDAVTGEDLNYAEQYVIF